MSFYAGTASVDGGNNTGWLFTAPPIGLWYAGANSTNGGNNTGWLFVASPDTPIYETTTLSDNQTGLVSFVVVVNEAIALSDTLSGLGTLIATVVESAILSDSRIGNVLYPVSTTESTILTEAITTIYQRGLIAESGSYSYIGKDSTLLHHKVITTQNGTYVITGNDIDIGLFIGTWEIAPKPTITWEIE